MTWFKKFGSMVKEYPTQAVALAVVAVVFLGGTILGLYNRARAAVPQLPAPK